MIIITVLMACILVSATLVYRLGYTSAFTVVPLVTGIMSTTFLLASLLYVVAGRLDFHRGVQQINATRATIEQARQGENDPLENAAVMLTIVELNQWIATRKYWNTTLFDLWVPDEVDQLEPLR